MTPLQPAVSFIPVVHIPSQTIISSVAASRVESRDIEQGGPCSVWRKEARTLLGVSARAHTQWVSPVSQKRSLLSCPQVTDFSLITTLPRLSGPFPSQLCGGFCHSSTARSLPKHSGIFQPWDLFLCAPTPNICGFTSFYFSTIIFIKSPEAEKKSTHEQDAVIKKQKFGNYADVTTSWRSWGGWKVGGISHLTFQKNRSAFWGMAMWLSLCMFAECSHSLGLREVQILPVSLGKFHWKSFLPCFDKFFK